VFGCRGCENRLWLPVEIVEQQADSVGLVCDQCKRVASYSLDENSPNYDRTGALADAESDFEVMSPGPVRCEDRTCESPLVIFTLRSLSMDFGERLAELRSWSWLDVKCPRGHKISRPSYL
jgi:phage FluMu protein Com